MRCLIKNVIAIVLMIVANSALLAQTQVPEKMSYQAIIRNGSGQLVSNQPIGMQVSILQGSASGIAVYVETQLPSTNVNGLVWIEIGVGNVESGNFASIDWANGPYFIKTETDIVGGTNYTISGTSQLLSVPYALHAKTAETIIGGITEADPFYSSSIASGITNTDTAYWNNKLDSYTETDPIFTTSLASGITAVDTFYWNNKLDSYTETDPVFATSLASGITAVDTLYWNNKLDSYTETDPIFATSLASGITAVDTANWNNHLNQTWNISGNTGTIFGTHFIGTTDNVPLVFKVNNQSSALIEKNGRTHFGFLAGNGNINIYSTAIGTSALSSSNSGDRNTAIGYFSLMSNTGGSRNTALGSESMKNNTIGEWNTSVGDNALTVNTIGTHNSAFGALALNQNVSGGGNVAGGYGALMELTTGTTNTAIGMYANKSLVSGNNNLAMGYEAGYNNTLGTGNVFMGYRAGYNETGSNKLYIANSSINPPLIYGDFSTSRIGIGTINPSKEFTVKGDAQIQTKGAWVAGSKARLYFGEDDNIWIEHIHSIGLNLNTASGWSMTFMDGVDENMRINGIGNVGIGTNNPTEKFVVVGNVADGRIATFKNAFDEKFITMGQVVTDDGGYIKYKKSSNYTGIGVHGHSEQLIVNGIGNVGVGTTSPTAKLQVETYGFGNKTILGMNSILIQNQTPGSRTLLALAPNGTQNADLVIFHNSDYTTNYESMLLGYENTLDNFIIGTTKGGTGTARRLVIDATGAGSNLWKQLVLATNGNVGIGTLTPGVALEVNGAIKRTGGTSSQFLKADGSLDANTYLTAIIEVADEFSATAIQTSFTLTQTPSTNSKVKMYINGVRISNTAYSVSGSILTYNPANNGAYVLTAGDRIQFDYSY